MAEGNRLGHLQMGEAGHEGVGLALGQIQQAAAQAVQLAHQRVDGLTQIEPDVRRDLIVAGTPGVQFLAGLADARHQPRLDVHVHIFQRHRPFETPGLDFRANGVQPGDDLLTLRRAQHAHPRQHARMGDGAGDVLAVQALIEAHRGGEGFHEGIGALGKTPAPGLGGGLRNTHADSIGDKDATGRRSKESTPPDRCR